MPDRKDRLATATPKPTREGSTHKRAAILVAARELFLADGFDRSSVDAVAARAGVSKRTVYDYFGDKQALLVAVVDHAARSLMQSIDRHMAETLTDVTDLHAALVRFALRIVTETLGSVDYLALMRLVTNESRHLPQLRDSWMTHAPEEAIAGRLAQFAREGRLAAPNPRVAADHLVALTFLLAINTLGPTIASDDARLRSLIDDGVRAFLRAYAPPT